MPQFTPGATKVAGLSIPVSPAGVNCDAELYLTLDGVTKAATSGLKPFTSTGSAQDIQLPITLPSMQGTYMARVLINSGEAQLGAYQAVDNVVIAPLINALNIGGMLIVNNVNGQAFSSFGVDADGIPYGRLATPRVLSSPLTKIKISRVSRIWFHPGIRANRHEHRLYWYCMGWIYLFCDLVWMCIPSIWSRDALLVTFWGDCTTTLRGSLWYTF